MRLKSTARDYYHNFTLSSFLRLSELRVRMDFDFNNYELLDAAIFWFTNQERGKHGLSPLAFHPKLRQMARLHSSQMSKHHFFSHDNLYETQYKTLSNRLDSVKDQCFDGFMTFGENIALIATLEGSDSFYVRTTGGKHHFYDKNDHELIFLDCAEYAHLVVEGWMNSPGHRANILNTSFEYLGCGCELLLKKNDSIPYFNLTQNFGGGEIPIVRTPVLYYTKVNYLRTGKYKLPLVLGQCIWGYQVTGDFSKLEEKVGVVIEKNGKLGIRNLSAFPWTVTLTDGSVRYVVSGRGMPVWAGMKIKFGKSKEQAVII